MRLWARITVDLTPVAADRKIQIPEGRTEEWEAGERLPNLPELKRVAKAHKRAPSVFYLPEPPQDFDKLRDFRHQPSAEAAMWSIDLYAGIMRAHEQRDVLLEATPAGDWAAEPLGDASADDTNTDEGLRWPPRSAFLAAAPFPMPGGTPDRYEHLKRSDVLR